MDKKSVWIAKPSNNACGRGIRLIHPRGVCKLPSKSSWVVQKYITNPLLVRGKKFDIRLYVLVTSVDPLRLYLFQEGLVRWCTEDFSLEEEALKDKFRHLTNFAINKNNPNFSAENDSLESGKCSFQVLLDHLHKNGYDTGLAVHNIRDLIVKTLIAGEPEIVGTYKSVMRHPNVCFELFGFDVMLDENLKSWLIEVNIYPSLMSGADIDRKVKGQLISDMLQLVGVPPATIGDCEREITERLLLRRVQGTEQPRRQSRGAAAAGFGRSKSQDEEPSDSSSPIDEKRILGLTTAERQWLEDLVDEEMRMKSGAFERLFPQADTLPAYIPLFTPPRASDKLVQQWLDSPSIQRNTELLASLPAPDSFSKLRRLHQSSSAVDSDNSSVPMETSDSSSSLHRRVTKGARTKKITSSGKAIPGLRSHSGHVRSLRRKVLLSRSHSDHRLSPRNAHPE